jgi:hypothetical protein
MDNSDTTTPSSSDPSSGADQSQPTSDTTKPSSPEPSVAELSTTSTNTPNLDNIGSGFLTFIRKKWWLVALLIIGCIGIGFIAPIYAVIIFIVAISGMRFFFETDLFKAFADSNGYTFTKKALVEDQTGLIFNIGHGRIGENLVSGAYQRWPFLLFLYSYTVGYGRDSHTFHRGVMSIDFSTTLPAFVLRKHKHLEILEEEGESLRNNGYSDKLNLEGDMNDHFQVYIRPNTQIDVLTILTPDTMELLIKLDKYEIEMTAYGQFYVYCHGFITKKQDLVDMYTIVGSVLPKIGSDALRTQQLQSAQVVASTQQVTQNS